MICNCWGIGTFFDEGMGAVLTCGYEVGLQTVLKIMLIQENVIVGFPASGSFLCVTRYKFSHIEYALIKIRRLLVIVILA